ncbi:MAG: restriction endonuclease subunit S [Betaproteobacteria bacterium]|nr:MAG: restriction endonuclease subunit S [Betaproteobacteria bacterium]
MRWLQTTIGHVCLPTGQRDPSDSAEGTFRYVDIAGIDRESKTISRADTISCSDAPSRARKIIRRGDILVSTVRPNLNAVAQVPDDLDEAIASTGFAVLRANLDMVNSRYLFYWAQHEDFVNFLITNATGAHYPAVSDAAVRRASLPLPTLSEQRRIVEILDEAARLRKLRSEADAKAGRILPALFLKMFGDPATNPKGWPTMPLRSTASKYSDGPFGSNLKSEHYVSSGIRVVRLQNIGVGVFLDSDKAYISAEHFASLAKHECRPGDVLIATLGDPNLRACIQPKSLPIALNKADCVQLRVADNVAAPEYVCSLLNMPSTLSLAQSLVLGQTRTRISMGRLGELVVPVPPIDLQHRFASKSRVLTRLHQNSGTSTLAIEGIYKSVLHQAFSGHLTAKWRGAHLKGLIVELEQQARLLNLPPPSAERLAAEA